MYDNPEFEAEIRYRLDELETDYKHALLYNDNDRNRVNAALFLHALADVRRVLDV